MSAWTDRRDAARQRGIENPELIPHGTPSGFDYWGCKCGRCQAAKHNRWAVQKDKVNQRRNAKLRQARALKRAREDVAAELASAIDVLYGSGAHADHVRRQMGKCVFCSCGARVQGKIVKKAKT